MKNSKYTLGVDIGGTNVRCGAVSSDGKVVEVLKFKTWDYIVAENFVERLADDIVSLIRKYDIGDGKRVSVGIGAPNGNYYRSTIEFAPNLPFKGVFELGKMLTKSLSSRFMEADIVLTNDANAAAMGEKIYGKAKEISDFMMITLGTGVGSGVFVDNKLLYGFSGFAGELGHTIIVPNGRLCGCGRRGCLETYCSAKGIARTAAELLDSKYYDFSLLDIETGEPTGAEEINKAAEKGDELALKCFDITAKHLALGLSNAVALTSPEKIFIAGGLSNAGKKLFNPLRAYFNEFLYPVFRKTVSIEQSGLPENRAAILGAASLTAF